MRFSTPDEAYEIYQKERQVEKLLRYYSALELKPNGQTIGAIRIDAIDWELSIANLHLELHPNYWGQGFITEAGNPVICWAFENISLSKFQGTAHPKNIRSQKALIKLGFLYQETVDNYKEQASRVGYTFCKPKLHQFFAPAKAAQNCLPVDFLHIAAFQPKEPVGT